MVEPVSQFEQLVLMESPEARQLRRSQRLATLSHEFGHMQRGKRREDDGFIETMPRSLTFIEENTVIELGTILNQNPVPLMDKITDNHHPEPDPYNFMKYVTAGNGKRKVRHGSTPEEQIEIRQSMQRQTQEITDGLMSHVRVQWQTARLYKAGLENVQICYRQVSPINENAAFIASSAIEDLGFCLRDKPALQKIRYKGNLAADIARVGRFTSAEPETLLAQPLLLLLAKREAEKRIEYWGFRFNAYRRFDNNRDRRTAEDKNDDLRIDELIESFNE